MNGCAVRRGSRRRAESGLGSIRIFVGLSRPIEGCKMEQYTKKMWTPQGFFADHRMVFRNLLRIAGAYVGPNAVDPELNESVMVTVNSVNSCPYCEGLHGELARMAGVQDPEQLMSAQSLSECTKVVDDPAIMSKVGHPKRVAWGKTNGFNR